MALAIDMRQVVLAISRAVDLVGVDDVMHGRRVGVMAAECAKRLGWDDRKLNLLFDAALLHDCGVSSTRVHRNLLNELDWEGTHFHCEKGSDLISSFTPLAHVAPIIRHHHTHWDEMSLQGIPHEVAQIANLIYLADRVDITAAPYYGDDTVLHHVEEIRGIFARHRGTFFAPELVDAFLTASRAEAFWLLISPEFISPYLGEMEQNSASHLIGVDELKVFALIIADIVDAKSPFTTDHSLGVGRLARFLGEKAGIGGEHLQLLEIAALLHDIGKLQIPDDLLENCNRLSEAERNVMKKHSFATYQILKRIGGLGEVALWAAYHHESLNGRGYPFRLQGGEIPLESRIIKVADIYQALSQDRPYRRPLPQMEILPILRTMQAEDEVDARIVDMVARHLDECHRIATGEDGDSDAGCSSYTPLRVPKVPPRTMWN